MGEAGKTYEAKLMPNINWEKQTLKYKVTAKGIFGDETELASSGITDIKQNTLHPIDIWKSATLSGRTKLNNSSTGAIGSCPKNATSDNTAEFYWTIDLDLGGKKLLHPIDLKLLTTDRDAANPGNSDIVQFVNIDFSANPKRISESFRESSSDYLDKNCGYDDYGDYRVYLNVNYLGKLYKHKTVDYFNWSGKGSSSEMKSDFAENKT